MSAIDLHKPSTAADIATHSKVVLMSSSGRFDHDHHFTCEIVNDYRRGHAQKHLLQATIDPITILT